MPSQQKKLAEIKEKLTAAEQEVVGSKENQMKPKLLMTMHKSNGKKLPMRWQMNGKI